MVLLTHILHPLVQVFRVRGDPPTTEPAAPGPTTLSLLYHSALILFYSFFHRYVKKEIYSCVPTKASESVFMIPTLDRIHSLDNVWIQCEKRKEIGFNAGQFIPEISTKLKCYNSFPSSTDVILWASGTTRLHPVTISLRSARANNAVEPTSLVIGIGGPDNKGITMRSPRSHARTIFPIANSICRICHIVPHAGSFALFARAGVLVTVGCCFRD